MLVKFAKKSLNQQLFLVVVAFILLILNLIFPEKISTILKPNNSFIGENFLSIISSCKWLNYLIITLLFALICLMAHLLMKKHKLSINTFFPFFIFEVLVCVIPNYLTINSLMMIILILLAFNSLMQMYKTKQSMLTSFAASFYISLASVLDFNLIWLNIIVLFSLIVFGNYKLRDWIMAILGMAFVYFWLFLGLFYWGFFSGNSLPSILNEFSLTFDFNIILSKINLSLLVFLAIVFLISFPSVFYLLSQKKLSAIETSKKIMVLSLFFLLTFLSFLFTSFDCNLLILCFVFASFFISEFFLRCKNKFLPELLCYTLIILAILVKLNIFYTMFSR